MMTRRNFISVSGVALLSGGLAACVAPGRQPMTEAAPVARGLRRPEDVRRYGELTGDRFPVAAVDLADIDPAFLRQEVDYVSEHPVGTVVVDTPKRYVYLVREGGKAMRYGVGVGREGLEFKGTANIAYKREWPRWTPTPDMIKRDPEHYKRWSTGMDGGVTNPLGARALYLFQNGRDTLYRIHGTTEPWSIGQAVSSGCIRMINQDVIDFYGRVPSGSKVVVLQA